MICGSLIILIIFSRHTHDNYGLFPPTLSGLAAVASQVFFFFFLHLSDVHVLWLLTVSLPQKRTVRCVLSASVHACLCTWTWHILSWRSTHQKPVLTIKWNMHVQLFSHSPSSGPLQTRLKKSFTRCATFYIKVLIFRVLSTHQEDKTLLAWCGVRYRPLVVASFKICLYRKTYRPRLYSHSWYARRFFPPLFSLTYWFYEVSLHAGVQEDE